MNTKESSAVWVGESNGQVVTHSNHLGTHLDGEIDFFTPGKDIAPLDLSDSSRKCIGFFPWRFVDGESCIGRCAAIVDDDEYEELMARKEQLPLSRSGDCYDPEHAASRARLTRRF